MPEEYKADPMLVELTTHTVELLAKERGYQTYPRQSGVELVLEALAITREALEALNKKHGR